MDLPKDVQARIDAAKAASIALQDKKRGGPIDYEPGQMSNHHVRGVRNYAPPEEAPKPENPSTLLSAWKKHLNQPDLTADRFRDYVTRYKP